MEDTSVISVRLPNSTIAELDKLVKDFTYYKRNAIIAKVLDAFLFACDKKDQHEIVRWWLHGSVR